MQQRLQARAWAVVAGLVLVVIAAAGLTRELGSDRSSERARQGSSTGATRVAQPPAPAELRSVLDDWTRGKAATTAVVGVQVGDDAPVFAGSASVSSASRFRVGEAARSDLAAALHQPALGLHDTANRSGVIVSTPRDLLRFSTGYLRAHGRGSADLATGYFAIGADGHGRGVEGFSSDGFCAAADTGCAPGTPFFAVGATGTVAGGSAVVVYDPRYDVSVVAVARSRGADLDDLTQRAILLTTLGAAGYERAVGFTARRAPAST